jgi:cell division protein FtsB
MEGHMMGSAKTALFTLALFGLLAGCEDKQCKADLQTCRSTSESQVKSMDSLKAENEGLKAKAAQVDQLMARVQELTKENETLKAAPPKVVTKHK